MFYFSLNKLAIALPKNSYLNAIGQIEAFYFASIINLIEASLLTSSPLETNTF